MQAKGHAHKLKIILKIVLGKLFLLGGAPYWWLLGLTGRNGRSEIINQLSFDELSDPGSILSTTNYLPEFPHHLLPFCV